ncbi:MAG: hopanoid-associated sugar epimerase [Acidimicrobiales bacterium]
MSTTGAPDVEAGNQAAGERGQPEPSPVVAPLQPGDRVAVSGAGGFIGSAITRVLLARGASVVALVEPEGDRRNLRDIDVELFEVDVRDAATVRRAVKGARFVFHAAAVYGFWARDPAIFYDVNVEGTRHVIDAVAAAGCERMVYTSTVGTIGLHRAARGEPADETCVADVAHLFGHYKQSKYVAEHEILRAAAQGLPVNLVLPTFPLGPRDRRPTPTGKLILDFLNGKIPGYVDTSLNVAHVDDLAQCHLLALERGQVGRSYIAGGENLTMRHLLSQAASVTGLPAPKWQFPRALALAAGIASDTVQGRLLGREPFVALEAARMSTTNMIFDDARVRRELGYVSRPPIEAIEDSVRWFVENSYVRPDRRATIRLP